MNMCEKCATKKKDKITNIIVDHKEVRNLPSWKNERNHKYVEKP